ncbi:hypothetical protein ACCC92_03320 [Mucilaginibacter sp. Mucisp84]|uniref:hypothetical protein n=1 Tax=Mucilaginibacter sp. Mucisp84 TaxID=3243058 RepID=UPI0039A658E4
MNTGKQAKRLSPSAETLRRLMLRSGNECAFPDCGNSIFNDNDELIGECCHIEAAMPGGERFNPAQTLAERRAFENLIFLCHQHHIETNDVSVYTVPALKRIKENHEIRFREKPFQIKAGYVEQVLATFKDIEHGVTATLATVERIEQKQDTILKMFEGNQELSSDQKNYSYFFGAPSAMQFKGRTKELAQLKASFKNYNTILVGGISGVGKTSFISAFSKSVKSHKLLWIDCEVEITVESFLLLLSQFMKQEFRDDGIGRISSEPDQDKSDSVIVAALNKYPAFIVFDALNSSSHELIRYIRLFNKQVSNSKIIVNTNIDIDTSSWHNTVSKILLQGVDKKTFSSLLKSYQITGLSNEIAEVLYTLLNGHPLLLKLTSSLFSYQPANLVIEFLEKRGSEEIGEYIRVKIFENLNNDEIEFIRAATVLGIPFRHSFGDSLNLEKPASVFRSLKGKFLLENRYPPFYVLPEFIRIYAAQKYNENLPQYHEACVKYLDLIKDNVAVFEFHYLIHHALAAHMTDFAKNEAEFLLSSLIRFGSFNLAYKIADDLLSRKGTEDWSLLFYIQGRVLRFQENYQAALRKYEEGISISKDETATNVLLSERASILIHLATELNDNKLREKAITDFKVLAQSSDIPIQANAKLSLATDLLHSRKYKEAISIIKNLLSSISPTDTRPNSLANTWQLLGNAYSSSSRFKKAIACFDKSLNYYKDAVEKFGMQSLEGLYHLHESYAWTCVRSGDIKKAVQIFEHNVMLCSEYDLGTKAEKALFDLGYHNILAGDFQSACEVLQEHYSFIIDHDLRGISDMKFVYGTLMFVHWQAGDYENATELLGLYIIECHKEKTWPAAMIMEESMMQERPDILEYFKKRAYMLIIPKPYDTKDLMEWVTQAIAKNPFVEGPLKALQFLKKE